jgi:hypothetical protein
VATIRLPVQDCITMAKRKYQQRDSGLFVPGDDSIELPKPRAPKPWYAGALSGWRGMGRRRCCCETTPKPTGVCCHSDISCTITTEEDCDGIAWSEQHTSCDPNPCVGCVFGTWNCTGLIAKYVLLSIPQFADPGGWAQKPDWPSSCPACAFIGGQKIATLTQLPNGACEWWYYYDPPLGGCTLYRVPESPITGWRVVTYGAIGGLSPPYVTAFLNFSDSSYCIWQGEIAFYSCNNFSGTLLFREGHDYLCDYTQHGFYGSTIEISSM